MSNEYEITTIVDLLQLDDGQIDRLCAELPSVIKHARNLMDLIGVVADTIEVDSPIIQMISPLRWIDDGEKNIDININSGEEDSLSYKVRASD